MQKAHQEYEKFVKKQDQIISPVEQHFIESLNELDALAEGKTTPDKP